MIRVIRATGLTPETETTLAHGAAQFAAQRERIQVPTPIQVTLIHEATLIIIIALQHARFVTQQALNNGLLTLGALGMIIILLNTGNIAHLADAHKPLRLVHTTQAVVIIQTMALTTLITLHAVFAEGQWAVQLQATAILMVLIVQ